MKKLQRGLTLITALAIVAIFLALSIMMLELATHNSQNVGASYTKQQYFDVAEAGIDRGLTDIDSNLPAPGASGFGTTPPNPPPAPSGDQTALPSEPDVPFHYSYWHNPNPSAASTADPLRAQGFDGAGSTITVPGYGTLIWSYTKSVFDGQPTGRDVGVEVLATVFSTQYSTCAMCAGGDITVTGSSKVGSAPVPTSCVDDGVSDKICTDPNASPNPAPTSVPVTLGGHYYYKGTCSGSCAYGDGLGAPNSNIQPGADTSAFLDPQSTIDEMSNASMWKTLSKSNGNIFYNNCASGCGTSTVNNLNGGAGLAVGQVAFFDGNLGISGNKAAQYSGLMIVGGCLTLSGPGQLQGISTTSETIVLGTDAQCGGTAFSVSGNAVWWGGTLYTANGSVSISGTGNVKYTNFYGDIIAAGTVTISGNGNFAYQSGLKSQSTSFGQYAVDSFMQY